MNPGRQARAQRAWLDAVTVAREAGDRVSSAQKELDHAQAEYITALADAEGKRLAMFGVDPSTSES